MIAQNIVLIVHYFPPINSSGARRMLAASKYFAKAGRNVTVITTTKNSSNGAFTESLPDNVSVIELSPFGQIKKSVSLEHENGISENNGNGVFRKIKDIILWLFGQLPDFRLLFALSFASPFLPLNIKQVLASADVIVATTPPWPPLLAAIILKRRFKKPVVMDYRDNFSGCHEMPGSAPAKWAEFYVDRFLAKRADLLVTISQPMGVYYREFNQQTTVIENGYDPDAFNRANSNIKYEAYSGKGKPLTVRYLGLIYFGRIPYPMLTALENLYESGTRLENKLIFEFYGDCIALENYLNANHPNLLSLFRFFPAVPYMNSLQLMCTADYLFFSENTIAAKESEKLSAAGNLTTKLFEYVASTRPIIAQSPVDSLAGSYIVKASSKHFVSNSVQDFENLFRSEEFWSPPTVELTPFVQSLSRSAQAEKYLELLDGVVAGLKKPS